MKYNIKRAAALILAMILFLSTTVPVLASEGDEEVYIRSIADLEALAKNCRLDTWSQGKTVILTQDLSLSPNAYAPIPTFGGTFEGGGHIISGLELTGNFSPAGLFGTVQEGAVIRDLHVSGTVAPSGKGGCTGGLAGRNSGLITDCSFSGSVTGENSTGALVGINEENGTLQNCISAGTVSGKSMTGGIVGKNMGVVSACTNRCQVNTESVDPSLELEELDLTLSVNLLAPRSMDVINVATDTGGVAGYSSGMLLGCINGGTIGYPHIGYNVGGIAGRNCGHVANCVNRTSIFGRKDVGGIVGQAEPDVVLKLTEDHIQKMQNELDQLNALIIQTADSADATSDDLYNQLNHIGEEVSTASEHTQELSGLISDYGDDVLTELNRGGDILANTMDRLADISEDLPDLSAKLTSGLDQLEDALRDLAKISEFTDPTAAEIKAAADELGAASQLVGTGTIQIFSGLRDLAKAVRVKDEAAALEALNSIRDGLADMSTAMQMTGSVLQSLAESLKGSGDPAQISQAMKDLGTAFQNASAAFSQINQGVTDLRQDFTFDLQTAQAALKKIQEGVISLNGAMSHIRTSLRHLQEALTQAEGVSDQLKQALERMANALRTISGASNLGSDLFSQIESLFSYLSRVNPIQIAHPGDEIGDSADALFDTLEQLRVQMDALNGTASSATGRLTDHIRAITQQMSRVTGAMTDAIYAVENPEMIEDSFADTSHVNIDTVTSGRILSCRNTAAVCGDIGVGGIAGAMAVEYELDPEDDLAADVPIYRRKYELKVILQNCVNSGKIVSRRDYAGSVCGQMELGLITECEGYGTVESENGSYVGGIAGSAAGTIQNSWSKCALSGKKYTGGITGAAKDEGTILNCRSLVIIPACEQYAGAITGGEGGTLSGNLFVSDELAGISMVSLKGQAEPLDYEQLTAHEALPEAFRHFTLRFWAEDELIAEVPFSYGDSFGPDVFPEIPAKEGYFARWDRYELDDLRFDVDVTAVYSRYISALETDFRREDGRPVFFVEGLFSENDVASALSTQISEEESGLPQTAGTLLEQWRLKLPADGQDTHSIRYLVPEGIRGNPAIYVRQNGDWKPLESESFGSYLMFETEGSEVEIAVTLPCSLPWVWIGLGVGLLAAIPLIVIIRIKRRGKKETARAAQEK